MRYYGYLSPYKGFILAELAKGTSTFATARMLYDRGVRTRGSLEPRNQIAGLNTIIRFMLGPQATKRNVLNRRIAAKKDQISRLKEKLDKLRTEKRALRAKA